MCAVDKWLPALANHMRMRASAGQPTDRRGTLRDAGRDHRLAPDGERRLDDAAAQGK